MNPALHDPNRARLIHAATLLGPLTKELVFVGGSVVGLLITDPLADSVRSTIDVDVAAEITTYIDHVNFAERLRQRGFQEDISPGSPTCRFTQDQVILDVIPIEKSVLGFANPWHAFAIRNPQTVTLAPKLTVRVITAPCFIASKLAAFHSRGKRDYLASHDLEDLIFVINGRESLLTDFAAEPPEVRSYVASELTTLLKRRAFLDALPGHLAADSASQARIPELLSRLRALSQQSF